ncbi:hypothetical protein K466DRAFT_48167 [Polyporus arcularius HHB13444]|uniref:Uncharacterized protein n=1 Tax=Polyporus arcularius HHB13444 TaxID=1314778 RepID=A0A5C3Q115_9APHY|nr:hypothetical protein K466DRAFT_48167 [Polyporus arcularius HHB13444]
MMLCPDAVITRPSPSVDRLAITALCGIRRSHAHRRLSQHRACPRPARSFAFNSGRAFAPDVLGPRSIIQSFSPRGETHLPSHMAQGCGAGAKGSQTQSRQKRSRPLRAASRREVRAKWMSSVFWTAGAEAGHQASCWCVHPASDFSLDFRIHTRALASERMCYKSAYEKVPRSLYSEDKQSPAASVYPPTVIAPDTYMRRWTGVNQCVPPSLESL